MLHCNAIIEGRVLSTNTVLCRDEAETSEQTNRDVELWEGDAALGAPYPTAGVPTGEETQADKEKHFGSSHFCTTKTTRGISLLYEGLCML